MLSNITYLVLITFILIFAGWTFKACISLLQGKPVELNLKNPLNLKARWPKDKKDQNE